MVSTSGKFDGQYLPFIMYILWESLLLFTCKLHYILTVQCLLGHWPNCGKVSLSLMNFEMAFKLKNNNKLLQLYPMLVFQF